MANCLIVLVLLHIKYPFFLASADLNGVLHTFDQCFMSQLRVHRGRYRIIRWIA